MTEQKSEALDIVVLEPDPRCQVRVEMNPEAVDHYAELMKDDVKFRDPVEVFEVDGKRCIVDGFHRVAAARQADKRFIRCVTVGSGTMDEAIGVALSKNHDHGVRRTSADKRHAVKMALDLGWGEDGGSNRKIAKRLEVSEGLVRKVRPEWEAEQEAKAGGGAYIRTPEAGGDTDEPTDETQGETQADDEPTNETSASHAQVLAEIANTASQLHKAAKAFHGTAKKAHARIGALAGDDLSDLVEVAADVSKDAEAAIASAKVLDEAVAAVLRDESEMRKAS